MADYKVSPELKRPAKAKWLSDDYVKFIRLAENMIAKTGEGVLGFITNHGYLDNPTFLDMRNHLRQTFDRIHVLDLHGNTKKKEVAPDGSADKNVFDIQQGVAIIIAVKRKATGKDEKKLAEVFHGDLWGNRDAKYAALWSSDFNALATDEVALENPPWRFKPSDKALEASFAAGFSIADLFSPNGRPAPGIVTTQDEFAISWSAADAAGKVERLLSTQSEAEARQLFRLCSQSQWNYAAAKGALSEGSWREAITSVAYRPFDTRKTVFNSHVAVHRRERVMRHLAGTPNIALCTSGNADCLGSPYYDAAILVSHPTDFNFFRRGGAYTFPLYLYSDPNDPVYTDCGHLDESIRINFEPKLYAKIRAAAGLSGHNPVPDGTDTFRRATGDTRPHEVQVFDYIYGVLHCPAYRETYREFLKVDFPRVPFPPSPDVFRRVSEQGEALRRLHLMEEAAIGETPYVFEGEGNNVVDQLRFEHGKVWINPTQGFAGVPDVAWTFHIGGYQPAQKWLKDRKGRELGWDDIRHYQRIIKILAETDRIMREIESPLG